jgi:cell division protein FtsZ
VQGIAELITRPGLINVDFADVRTVMSETGMAMMGSGIGRGAERARIAAEAAVSSPLLEHVDLADAHGILVNVTAGMDLSIGEFQEVGTIVKQFASDDATVVVGTVIDPEMSDELRVTVVATGLNRSAQSRGRGDAFPQYREPAREPAREVATRVPPRRAAAPLAPVPTNYHELDKPAVQRYVRAVGDGISAPAVDDELLDIPAFLRRQAD